jgi:hypothetical protein
MSDRQGPEREARIRRRAHAIWEQEGRPHGKHQIHWDQATHDVASEEQQSPQPASQRDALKAVRSAKDRKRSGPR